MHTQGVHKSTRGVHAHTAAVQTPTPDIHITAKTSPIPPNQRALPHTLHCTQKASGTHGRRSRSHTKSALHTRAQTSVTTPLPHAYIIPKKYASVTDLRVRELDSVVDLLDLLRRLLLAKPIHKQVHITRSGPGRKKYTKRTCTYQRVNEQNERRAHGRARG